MRKPWDSNPQAGATRRPFSRRAPHPAGWLPSPISSGGWDRTSGLLGQSQASLPAATAPDRLRLSDSRLLPQARGGGLEPPPSGPKPGGLPLADPRECPAGVEPACPAWEAGASTARPRAREGTSRGGRRGSRTPKAHRSAVFETAAITHWLALPRSAPAAGIEPASSRLTAGRPYQHGPRRNRPVGAAGFEPALSCPRSRRIARLSHAPSRPSAQRESNPHFRHGKAAGYRYIMGTLHRHRIVKESESTGWDSNPRRRITGAVSSPLDDHCWILNGTRGTRTLTCPVKSRVCCR